MMKVGFVGCGEMGEPMAGHVLKSGKFEVWIYDGLLPTGFNLFLRSMVAARCRGAQAYLGPVSPAALGVPKENWAGPQRPGTVRLAPGGEVTLLYPKSTWEERVKAVETLPDLLGSESRSEKEAVS